MKKTIQRTNNRGTADHGWLKANFSFSFANYYNPQRMGFGKLRVLNDDTIAPHKGFGTHPHENMEIITIPTAGVLAHKDSTGVEEVIEPGQIQVMSAGSGILHSEYNHSKEQELKLFQIWIETAQQHAPPRHETRTLNLQKNKLTKIVSGNSEEDTAFIYQDASLYLGEFDEQVQLTHAVGEDKGVFILVVKGTASIENEQLGERDSIEISQTHTISIVAEKKSKILLIEVPM